MHLVNGCKLGACLVTQSNNFDLNREPPPSPDSPTGYSAL